MEMMSGLFSAPGPPEPPERRELEDDLFQSLVVTNPTKRESQTANRVSLAFHGAILLGIVFVPIFWPQALPDTTDTVRALLYDPPPPPPPPLPKGSALVQKTEPAKPVKPETKEPEKPKFESPVQPRPEEKPLVAENRPPDTEQFGSDKGSDNGVAEGMDVGVEGGQVGGVPGGVLGGVIGGTGTGPVMDYDLAPRPIKLTKPQYPQEAFVKKIEGTVIVEILIDATGRVIRARIIQSVPALDKAAIQTVYQWVFSPAMKHGQPVATIANAPVAFRIF
jgi:protein TonB